MQTAPSAQLAELLSEPEYLAMFRKLADQRATWFSKPELAWRIGGESYETRLAAYEVVDALIKTDVLETIKATHNQKPLVIVKIDQDAIRSVILEHQQ